ncbi:MAG: hypothetical protein ACRDRS_13900 [Pseudonocardiaceae bacterium]
MTDQPRTRHPIQVSIQGTRADTAGHAETTPLATQEPGGTWLIHPRDLDRVAVRLTEEQAARLATAIPHLVSPHAARAARATASPYGDQLRVDEVTGQ